MHFACTFCHCSSEHLLSICNFPYSLNLFVTLTVSYNQGMYTASYIYLYTFNATSATWWPNLQFTSPGSLLTCFSIPSSYNIQLFCYPAFTSTELCELVQCEKSKFRITILLVDNDDDDGVGQCISPDQVLRGLADYRSALLNFLPMNSNKAVHCRYTLSSYCMMMATMMMMKMMMLMRMMMMVSVMVMVQLTIQ